MESKLNDKNIDNYYVDVTYRIIPNYNNKYKLMTISCTNKENISYIYALILLKFEDYISFIKIFEYLNSMYNFNPHIIHIDYSKSLTKALKKKIYSIRNQYLFTVFFTSFKM